MKGKSGIVYFIQQDEDHYFKIGKTKVSASRRLIENQVGNPKRLRIYGKIKCADVNADEIKLHHKYFMRKQHGEWFNLTPHEVEAEIESWGDNGRILIRTPKPDGILTMFIKLVMNNKAISFMYVYLQFLALNSTHVAAKKYFPYLPEHYPIQFALTVIICSQLVYLLFFDSMLRNKNIFERRS